MEQLFTTNREEFIRFINFMKDMIFVMEVDNHSEFHYLIINRAAKERLKVDEEIIGKNLEAIMREEAAYFIKERYLEVLKKKKQLSYEYSIGDNLYEESILNPIMNDSNQVTHIISITRDTSQRKLTEQKLMESEERYRLIAENSKALIQLLTPNWTITYASPSHDKVLGIHPDDLVNEPLERIIPMKEREKIISAQECILDKKAHVHRECNVIHKDGLGVSLSLDMIPIINEENGELKQILLVGENITERKLYEKNIHQMAYYDHLTGLPNVQLLQILFDQAIDLAKKNVYQVAILYVDCDHFKTINDTYGHYIGDHVLKELANRFHKCLPSKKDTVSRIGGDEFNIILNEVHSKKMIDDTIERMYKEIDKPWCFEDIHLNISLSIGVSLYPADGTDMQMLVRKADDALYRAKRQGKNCYKYY